MVCINDLMVRPMTTTTAPSVTNYYRQDKRRMMNKPSTPLSTLLEQVKTEVKMLQEKSQRDGAESEYLIKENARLRRELNELKAKIEGKKI